MAGPVSLKVLKEVVVRDNDKEVFNLNELEHFSGTLFANVWNSERIAAIEPNEGKVQYWINLEGLHPREYKEHVLNGIAWDSKRNAMFVTGKCWSKIFQIEALPTKW